MAERSETIAAIATASGRGGIGIVRVSGPGVMTIAEAICGETLCPRHAHHLSFLDAEGEAIDDGVALLFNAPHSYTGEDVLELQGHGGSVVLDRVLARVMQCGARLARPGEFTERAYLNDRMDLAQAEAVADLIEASSEQAARAAMRSLHGEFSREVQVLIDELTALRVWLEAALDFSEEDIDFLSDPTLQERTVALREGFGEVMSRASLGQRLRDGLVVVIAGASNAGKSSLLNLLARHDAAIVTDIEGTTRDLLHQHIQLRGIPLQLIDTAGLRLTDDPIEKAGIERARIAIESADHVLILIDASADTMNVEALQSLPKDLPRTVIFNKIDQLQAPTELSSLRASINLEDEVHALAMSVLEGYGLDELEQHLLRVAGLDSTPDGVFIARRRHLDALELARQATSRALEHLQPGGYAELSAEELRKAQRDLEVISGRFDNEDLLGAIFGRFCIGK